MILALLLLLSYAAILALQRAGLLPTVLYIVVGSVVLFLVVLVTFFMGMMFGWDTIFTSFRPQKEFRQWTQRRAQDRRREMARLRSAGGIPAPGGDDTLRDPEFEMLVLTGDLHAAEKYLEEAMERARGDPTKLSVYTHYTEYLLSLRRETH